MQIEKGQINQEKREKQASDFDNFVQNRRPVYCYRSRGIRALTDHLLSSADYSGAFTADALDAVIGKRNNAQKPRTENTYSIWEVYYINDNHPTPSRGKVIVVIPEKVDILFVPYSYDNNTCFEWLDERNKGVLD